MTEEEINKVVEDERPCISADDIINLKILLETSKDVEFFLEKI